MYSLIERLKCLVKSHFDSNDRNSSKNARDFWYVLGKFIKKMGFLVTAASFVTWFVNPCYLPRVMACLYLTTMGLIYVDYSSKKKQMYDTSEEPSGLSSNVSRLFEKIDPYVKSLFTGLILFNISLFWFLQLAHIDKSYMANILQLPYAVLPYLAAITVASVAILMLKFWQATADGKIKNHAKNNLVTLDIDYLNKAIKSNRFVKAMIRGFSEWLLVFHNTFFLLLSCVSLGFFTLGSFSAYSITTLTAAAAGLATRVSIATQKFACGYLAKKVVTKSDYISLSQRDHTLIKDYELMQLRSDPVHDEASNSHHGVGV